MPVFNIKRPRVTGTFNHAGDLAPLRSGYYDALTATKGQAIAHPVYAGHQWTNAVRGTMGVVPPRAANANAIVGPNGYFGDTPTKLQGVVRAAPPWLRR